MFEFYSRHFDTVEINNTFYRLPAANTFDNWRDSSPRNFCYAVKGSRFTTHMKKLKDPQSSSEKFFHVADRLGPKLGPILFQLPPRWKLNLVRLDEFLRVLPGGHQYAVEVREATWLVPEVYKMLRKYNVAFCVHDFSDMKVPREITADFTYVRFHGPTSAKYWGSYSNRSLRGWADWIKEHRRKLSSIYAYFNNDPEGAAVRNALTLKQFLKT
jgi:uncharacterized protein YecE (DUF72 family)